VKWARVVYASFAEYAADAEWLVTRPAESAFDYVEGFAFVRSDDPVNGWPSVPIPAGARFDPSLLPAGESGPLLYCLEVALYQHQHQQPDDVDEVGRHWRCTSHRSRQQSSNPVPLPRSRARPISRAYNAGRAHLTSLTSPLSPWNSSASSAH
jgi:hypothetical protein